MSIDNIIYKAWSQVINIVIGSLALLLMLSMGWIWLLLITVSSLLPTIVDLTSCPYSSDISDIPNFRVCNNSRLVIPFDVEENCDHIQENLTIQVYHDKVKFNRDVRKHPPFIPYNDSHCRVHATMKDIITVEGFNDSRLQIWIRLSDSPYTCMSSNNFNLTVDSDEPPHKVTPTTQVNCTGIYASWPTPFFPPGCPILHYLLAINSNISDVINTTDNDIMLPFDLKPNTLYTIDISAVNSVGNSTKSHTFITAIKPIVSLMNDTLLVPGDPITANFTVIAKMDSNCTFSQPTHLYHNISCDGDIVSPSVNKTVNISDGRIIYRQSLPVGYLKCTAVFIWSNLNSSVMSIISFNTTQLLFIQLYPVTNGLNYTCHYRPNSSLWGCGISVLNNTIQVTDTIRMNETTGSITGLCSDVYSVMKFMIYLNGTHHMIDHLPVPVYVNGTCPSPTPHGTEGGHNHVIKIIISTVTVAFLIPVIILIIVLVSICCKNRKKPTELMELTDLSKGKFTTIPEENSGKHTISNRESEKEESIKENDPNMVQVEEGNNETSLDDNQIKGGTNVVNGSKYGNVVKGGISQVEVDSASNSLERDHDLFIGQEVKSNTNTGEGKKSETKCSVEEGKNIFSPIDKYENEDRRSLYTEEPLAYLNPDLQASSAEKMPTAEFSISKKVKEVKEKIQQKVIPSQQTPSETRHLMSASSNMSSSLKTVTDEEHQFQVPSEINIGPRTGEFV